MAPTIRYAQVDADIVAIHRFLCVVAGPMLPGPIDGPDSITEVWRVCTQEVALMAVDGDRLLGTFGITQASYWWNSKVTFLTNRWLFAVPGSGAWRPLLKEAKAIAVESEKELIVLSEARGRILILNRSPLRNGHAVAPPPSLPALPAPDNNITAH